MNVYIVAGYNTVVGQVGQSRFIPRKVRTP